VTVKRIRRRRRYGSIQGTPHLSHRLPARRATLLNAGSASPFVSAQTTMKERPAAATSSGQWSTPRRRASTATMSTPGALAVRIPAFPPDLPNPVANFLSPFPSFFLSQLSTRVSTSMKWERIPGDCLVFPPVAIWAAQVVLFSRTAARAPPHAHQLAPLSPFSFLRAKGASQNLAPRQAACVGPAPQRVLRQAFPGQEVIAGRPGQADGLRRDRPG
jgi:hypothetical protein